MERSSFFIANKAMFGGFPTQEGVRELEKNGVILFVDLTYANETKITPYKTKHSYIRYPIRDHCVPENLGTFACLILELTEKIQNLSRTNQEKIYIHCKGGHGRAGIVVACILAYYYNIGPHEALKITTKCHSERPEMREKWRKLSSPHDCIQKNFVYNFFQYLKYDQKHPFDNDNFFVEISIDNKIYVFPSVQMAIQKISELYPDEWKMNKQEYMYQILYYRFSHHESLRKLLLRTGLRKLLKISKDSFWGCGKNGQGKNFHGKILNMVRKDLYMNSKYNDLI